MKRYFLIFAIGVLLSCNSNAQDIYKKEYVKELMERVNSYQFNHPWQEYDDNWIRSTNNAGIVNIHADIPQSSTSICISKCLKNKKHFVHSTK